MDPELHLQLCAGLVGIPTEEHLRLYIDFLQERYPEETSQANISSCDNSDNYIDCV